MLTKTVIAAAAVAASLVLVALPAAAQTPPPMPTLPDELDDLLPKADTARFKVTIEGSQQADLDFDYDAAEGVDCSLQGRGRLGETWEYARGKDVVIVFKKLGPGLVLMQRSGRAPGDTAFAATGGVDRTAGGYVETRTPVVCNSFALSGSQCGAVFPVRSDLRLGWAAGKLSLESGSTSLTKVNPALACGQIEVWNFDVFSFRYPALSTQKGALSMKRLFKSKRNLKVELTDRFIGSAELPAGYRSLQEDVVGSTTIRLKRLKR